MTTDGYTAGDGVRQQFTQKERDTETGLDYFGARYFASTQGRFTSVDPIKLTRGRLYDPQRINLYIFCRNDPLKYLDPDGEDLILANEAARSNVERIVFKGLTSEERKNVDVAGNKVILRDPLKKVDSPSPAYKYLSQIVTNPNLTINFYGVEKDKSVTLSDKSQVSYADAFTANGLTTGAATDAVRDVVIPIGGGPLVAGVKPGEKITTPEDAQFAHEAYGHGLNNDAIEVENEYRADQKLPLRSGEDHKVTVTVTSAELLKTDTTVPQTYLQLKALRPAEPTKRPEQE